MRQNLKDVMKAWNLHKPLDRKSISTDGDTVFSYSTPLLYGGNMDLFNPKPWKLNMRKYSHTTTTQQSSIRLWLTQHEIDFVEVDGPNS